MEYSEVLVELGINEEGINKFLDKDWRMNNLYTIVNREGAISKFVPNRAQKHFNDNKSIRNIILKSRQLGFTTYEALDELDDVLFNANFKAIMLSYDIPSQLDIFDDKIKFAWESLPESVKKYYKVDTERANELRVEVSRGEYSSVKVRTKGRSGTFQRTHVSEFGKICRQDPKKAKEILSGTLQASAMGARVDFESTAEGEFGAFYDMFWEAWERGEPTNEVEYKGHFYNWQWDDNELNKIKGVDPNIPEDFYIYQRKHNQLAEHDDSLEPITDLQLTYWYYCWLTLNRDWNMLFQEYPTTPDEAFVSSGGKIFDANMLKAMKTEQGERVNDWIYYEHYIPGHTYAVFGDPSEGIGKDGAAAVVIDFSHKVGNVLVPKVVAEFLSNKTPPDIFAHELKNAGVLYGACLVGWERNNHGHAVTVTIKGIYNNLYTEVRQDKSTGDIVSEKLGWNTTIVTKPVMIYDLNTAINNEDILIPSRRIVRECRTYNKDDLSRIKYDDNHESHWDLLMACAGCLQMARHAFPTQVKQESHQTPDDPMDRHDVIGSIV